MEESDALLTYPDEIIAELKHQLRQAQAEIQALKEAQAQEKIQRKQVERDLKASRRMLQLVMDTLPAAIFWKDRHSVFLGCNRNFAVDAGLTSPEEIVGKTDFDMPWKPEESESYREYDRRIMEAGLPVLGIIETQFNSEGNQTWLETNKAPLKDSHGEVIGILGTYQDITERKETEIALQALNQKLEQQKLELAEALEQLQHSQLQLIQREKMSALGNLIAGVAHEINNPVGFLSGNLQPAQDYINDLFKLLDLYQHAFPQPTDAIQNHIETIDLEYIREDLPNVLHSMKEGIRRIANISTSLRTFSRADTEHRVLFQLHEGINSTLLILTHRLRANEQRSAIEVVRNYGEVPPIRCFPGQMNQVFMNLLANAIDALDEFDAGKDGFDPHSRANCITITTQVSSDRQSVLISIQDNGVGMSEGIQRKIFENSFTTKEVGKGTGLGLAIAHQIIVEKHGGTIDVHSEPGQGSKFMITMPIESV